MKKLLAIALTLLTLSAYSQSIPLDVKFSGNTPVNSKDTIAYRYTGKIGGYGWLYNSEYIRTFFAPKTGGNYLQRTGGFNNMGQSIIFNTNSITPDSVGNGLFFTKLTNYANVRYANSQLYFDFGDDPVSYRSNGVLQRYNTGGLGPRIDTIWQNIWESNRERFRYKNSDVITARQVGNGLTYTVSADSTNGGSISVSNSLIGIIDSVKKNYAYDLNYRVPIDTTQIQEFFGDSYTAGSLATAANKRYANIVYNTSGAPSLVNQGAGGSGIISAQNRNYSVSPTINNLRSTFIMSGLTDIGHIAPDTRLFSMLYNGYTSFIANKFLKTAVPASDASITYGGTWTTFAADSAGGKATYISGTARQTLTSGATATFTVPGNNVFIGTFASDSTKVKLDNFTITVDGNLAWAGSFDNQLKYFQPLSGGVPVFGLLNWYTQSSGVFLNNLGPGSHTIVVTKGSNTSRKLILDYVGTLNNPKNTGSLIVGEIAYLTDSARRGYHIDYGSTFTNASVDSANYIIKGALKAFQGYPVTIARTNHYFDYRTEVSSVDSLHPNDLGHLHIAQAFLGVMALPNYRSGYTFGDGLVTTGSTITNAITQPGGYIKPFSTSQGTPPGIAITQSGTTAISGPVFSAINTSVTTGGGVTGASIIASRSGTSVAAMTGLGITVNTGARAAGSTGTDLRGINLVFTGSTATSSTASNVRNNPFKVDLYNTTAAGESGTDIAGLFRVNGLSGKTATALRLVSRGSTTNDALNIDSGSVFMRELTALKPIFTDATKRFTSTGPGTSSQIFFGDGSFVTSSGDVTNSAGAFTIGANKVTYAKMQAAGAASRLVGSPSSGTTLQDITLGSNLNITSGTLNATSDTASLVTKGTAQNITGNKYYSGTNRFSSTTNFIGNVNLAGGGGSLINISGLGSGGNPLTLSSTGYLVNFTGVSYAGSTTTFNGNALFTAGALFPSGLYNGSIYPSSLTANQLYTLPNKTGTIALAENTPTVSSAGTLSLSATASGWYVFSGTTATWTLPGLAASGATYYIKNRGSGNLVINSNAGGNDIYTSSAVNTITLLPGEYCILNNDGTYFNKQ